MTEALWTPSEAGSVFGGAAGAEQVAQVDAAMERVPPYPGLEVVAPARVPPPPKLPSDATPEQLARACAVAYRGAVEARYRQVNYTFSRGVERSRYFAVLVAGGRLLLEAEIAPAAWVAWSVDIWREYRGAKVKPPAPDWVFSANRISERGGWFRSEGASYVGGQVRFGPSHRELIARWNGMVAALMRKPEAPEEVAAQHFPDGLYDVLVAKARREAAEEGARLRAVVERGGFPW